MLLVTTVNRIFEKSFQPFSIAQEPETHPGIKYFVHFL